MKIIHYCQHVLGIGHFFRSLEICKALIGHEVLLVSGGPEIDTSWPAHIQRMRLPGLMMDEDFKGLFTTEKGRSVDRVKEERQRLLFEAFEAFAPDIFIVELYPFGRRAFRFELDPLIKGIHAGELPSCGVICSLRDILVEKKDPDKYEKRILGLLEGFDALLIHSDPNLFKLDHTFSRVADIPIPVIYTGFVTPRPPSGAGTAIRQQLGIKNGEELIVASAGGGRVGFELLEAVLEAFRGMGDGRYLHVFTGPFMDMEDFNQLSAYSCEKVVVRRFTRNFTSYLAAADLSVSMAGYNTSMNILAAQTPALVWPFSQNREQRLRAESLARAGGMTVLDDEDLKPQALAALMNRMLADGKSPRSDLNLDGAAHTAKWLETWLPVGARK